MWRTSKYNRIEEMHVFRSGPSGYVPIGLLVFEGGSSMSNGIGTGPRIGFQSGPHRERGVTPLVSPAERVGVAQPG